MNEAIRRCNSTLPESFTTSTGVNGILYLSGQVPMMVQVVPVYRDVVTQIYSILGNSSKKTLCFRNIFKTTMWISDMRHFAELIQVYAKWFKNGCSSHSVARSRRTFELAMVIESQVLAENSHRDDEC